MIWLCNIFHSKVILMSLDWKNFTIVYSKYSEESVCISCILSQGSGFSRGHVWMWELDSKESWVLKNWCFWTVVLEKTLESPLHCKDPTSPSWRRSVLGVHWKDWCWSWNSNTLATWCEELTNLKRPWYRERLRVGGEGDDRGWDGWMASLTQWTWV